MMSNIVESAARLGAQPVTAKTEGAKPIGGPQPRQRPHESSNGTRWREPPPLVLFPAYRDAAQTGVPTVDHILRVYLPVMRPPMREIEPRNENRTRPRAERLFES
jgi:hypothetical protein